VINYELVIADCRKKIFDSADCTKSEIVDMIIKSIFDRKSPDYTSKKKMFWELFGDIVYENIRNNMDTIERIRDGRCIDCGGIIRKTRGKQCRCEKCQKIHRRKSETARIKRYRESLYAN
jgi:hypothetical protein